MALQNNKTYFVSWGAAMAEWNCVGTLDKKE
jgi:hypothetical protein